MEIEVKAKVEDLKEVREKLLKLGAKFSTTEQQDDSYFKPKGKEKDDQGPGSAIVRIRKESEGSFLTIKEMTDVSGVWKERETTIGNAEQMREILIENFNYSHIFDINKKRENGHLEGINLCLDDIKQLGKYVELEIHGEDTESCKNKMLDLFKKLDVDDSQIEHRGYARIISENNGIKFRGVK